MHVLLIEDDDAIAEPLVTGLGREGFSVTRVATASDALAAGAPEFVLLDLGLPDGDGVDVCRQLRERSDTPIIVLTARADEIDRVVLLELGADDYMVKPFGLRELIARIRAVARRAHPRADDPTSTTVGILEIDRRTRRVAVGGRTLALTPKEFDVLAMLAGDPDAVHRREDILERVWDEHWYGPSKTLDVHIASLRKKLGNADWIETIRGVGFRLHEPRAGA